MEKGKETARWVLALIVGVMGLVVYTSVTPPVDAMDMHGAKAASYALVVALALFVLMIEDIGSQGTWDSIRRALVQATGGLAAYHGSWEWFQGSMGGPVPSGYVLLWFFGAVLAQVCVALAFITPSRRSKQ